MNIAVITGASSGIGREFALKLDQFGLDELWLIARSQDKLVDLQDSLATTVRVIPLDLTKEHSFDKFAALLKEIEPQIVYLINDSGFGKFGCYNEVSQRDAIDMIDLNVKATVLMSKVCIPYIVEGGAIIQMSSSAAFTPLPNFNVYAATKAFIYHYSRALREELRAKSIAVTAVCPGWVRTNFFSVAEVSYTNNRPIHFRPIYQPSEIVEKALSDSDNDRAVSVYGIHTKLHRLAAKILPSCALIKVWLKKQLRQN